MRADERETEDIRYRAESPVRNIDEDEGLVRESRERECNTRSKAVRGISKEITNLGKDLDMDQDESGTSGTVFVSAKDDLCRLVFDIDELRARSKGGSDVQKYAVDSGCRGGGEGPEVRG